MYMFSTYSYVVNCFKFGGIYKYFLSVINYNDFTDEFSNVIIIRIPKDNALCLQTEVFPSVETGQGNSMTCWTSHVMILQHGLS